LLISGGGTNAGAYAMAGRGRQAGVHRNWIPAFAGIQFCATAAGLERFQEKWFHFSGLMVSSSNHENATTQELRAHVLMQSEREML
jgi:hypothetical protein